MFLYQGVREKIKEDLSIGMDYCPNCRIFTRFFLGRHLRIEHLNYIPLKTWVLDHAEFCDKCKCGRTLSQDAYNARTEILAPFANKKQQKQCYEKMLSLATSKPADEETAAQILDALGAEFPVKASPQLEEIFRRRVDMLLALHGRGGDPQACMHRANVQPVQKILVDDYDD